MTTRKPLRKEKFLGRLSPQWMIAIAFFFAILIGAGLLSLPIASADGTRLDFVSALFTSTSATCVTGLSVIDVGSRLSFFGQIVLISLVQFGGIGFTTFGTFLLVLVGRRLSVQSEFVLMDAYGVEEVKGLRSLLLWTMAFTFSFEGIGTCLLWFRYLHPNPVNGVIDVHGAGQAFYYAIFHAISAFCNAGFSLHPNSLESFRHDHLYLGTINALVVIGGLGFLVLYNLATIKFWRRNLITRGRLSLHTKVVLVTSACLTVVGLALFLVQEWRHALSALSWDEKVVCSLFHSLSARTAGFSVLPMDQFHELSRFTISLLMMVGGSPGSAAGGIKTTTLAVLVMTVIAMCRNRRETAIFSRTIPNAVVRDAIVIFLLALALIMTAYGTLLWVEMPLAPDVASKLMFEVISASATVGSSVNYTPLLSTAGRYVIIVCMFVGRLGPLAVALLLGNRDDSPQRIRYPEEEIVVG